VALKGAFMAKAIQGKQITITDVAKHVNVSPSTVSYVINNKAREKKISSKTESLVKKALKELGYTPNLWARGLQRKSTRVISVLLGNLKHNWAEEMVLGVEDFLSNTDYNYFIGVHHWDPDREKSEMDMVLQRRDEGVICLPVFNSAKVYRDLVGKGVPVVLLETVKGLSEVSFVSWDGSQGARAITEHLVSTGRKRIAYLGVHQGTVETEAKYRAYCDVLIESGLELNNKFIKKLYIPRDKKKQLGIFEEAVDSMFEDGEKPDAIFFLNDGLAIQGYKYLLSQGVKIPDDVAITGMGDLSICDEFGLGITTVKEPIREVGKLAAEVLFQHITTGNLEQIVKSVPSSELIIRKSTQK
jgi:DNA-binding LacI/PurR family transcriptional regulator